MIGRKVTQAPSVRANHRLLALCGVLGGGVGFATAMILRQQEHRGDHLSQLLEAPLPTWFAVAVALVWGVVLPVISWRWERVVDEHERRAYHAGAVAGFYVMSVGAPVWWFLWRGGLLPPVDAVLLYLAVLAAGGIGWAWRKYR